MKRKGFTILAVVVFALGTFGFAHATSGYGTTFKTTYSTSPLLKAPNPLDSQGRNCAVCHVDPGGGGTRTSYGEAFLSALTGTAAAALAAIEALDSDGDGYSNIAEILAGTYPGDEGRDSHGE
jgi:hypothetical protein